MHIAAVIMVKDESKLIKITLISCLGVVDSLVVYDTGSTDNTVEIIQEYFTKKLYFMSRKLFYQASTKSFFTTISSFSFN